MLGSLLGLSNGHGSYSSGHGSHGSVSSGYGSLSNGYGSGNCCPLVVNTKSFLALLGFMALAVWFLNNVIEMSALPVKRKKRSLIDHVLFRG